jgi:WD40 repeat protein
MRILAGIIIMAFFVADQITAQELAINFGNNNITTSSISFTPDGKYMVIGGFAKSYNLTSGKIDLRTIKKDTETQADYSSTVCVSTDGRMLLLAKSKRLDIWDLQSRTLIKSIKDNQLIETAASYSKDGRHIIYLRKNGEMVLLNASTFIESLNQKLTDDTPVSLAISPDGRNIATGTRNGSIIVYDTGSQTTTAEKAGTSEIKCMSISPSGEYIAASFNDGRIWLGRLPSLETSAAWQAHTPGNTVIDFHPSGKFLASGGKDRNIRIWNIPEGSRKEEWEAHKNAVYSLAFSPNGEMLATGSLNDIFSHSDDTKLWSVALTSNTFAATDVGDKTISKVTTPQQQVKPASPASQKRLALIIGNGSYSGSTLANPENDARDMKNALQKFDFDVLMYENLGQSMMKKAMDEFGEKLKGYDVGLFFYAGHGIQSKGYNYLIPVDAELKSESQVEYDCVQADRILALMEESGTTVNIIILDACRNNPFERSWTRSANSRGLAFMNAPSGSLIAYATAPGSTASDGSGKNGLYTSAILESINIPDLNILQIFQNVRSLVSDRSQGLQIPWESTSLTGDFFF